MLLSTQVMTVPANCSVQNAPAPPLKRPQVLEELIAQEQAIEGESNRVILNY